MNSVRAFSVVRIVTSIAIATGAIAVGDCGSALPAHPAAGEGRPAPSDHSAAGPGRTTPSAHSAAAGSAAPSLVLITLDTTRADRLGCYGAKHVATPSLDRLASRGVLFEAAISAAPLTLPAHCSIFTGLLPGAHGVRDNRGFRLAPERVTLAEVLKAHGFATGGFVGAYVLDHRWGIAQGFARYSDEFAVPRSRAVAMEEIQRRGDVVVRDALAWLSKVASGRFFAWIHLYDPHAPYDPPEPFRTRFASAPYDGEIAWTDSLVGRVLDGLAQLGVTERTIVAVIGDHGESLGEHGERGHGLFLYEPTTRVPFLLAGPGTGPPGRRVSSVVRQIDLAPTLLDLLGVRSERKTPRGAITSAKQAGSEDRSGRTTAAEDHGSAREDPSAGSLLPGSRGRSLVPLLRVQEPGGPGEAYSETFYSRLHFGWSELRAVRTGRHHFIEAPRPELYDLAADPGETKNLAATEPVLVKTLREALGRLEPETLSATASPSPSEEDEETLRKLAALGYTGSAPKTEGKSWRELPDPKDRIGAYALLTSAQEEAAAGHPDAAIAMLRKAVADDPEMTDAWFLLGGLFAAKHEWGAAGDHYRKALDRRPDHDYAMIGLADALMAEGRTDDAITACRGFLTARPSAAFVHHQLGRALFKAKRFEDAEHEFSLALTQAPDLAEAAYDIGAAREARSEFAEAMTWFRKAFSIDPSYHEAHAALARRLFASGDRAGAATELRAALRLSPSNPVYEKALKDLETRASESPPN